MESAFIFMIAAMFLLGGVSLLLLVVIIGFTVCAILLDTNDEEDNL